MGYLPHSLCKAIIQFDWSTLARIPMSLKQLLQEDSLGLMVRSRCQGQAETKVASIYHLNRGVKNSKEGWLDKLAKMVSKGPKPSS